MKPYVGITGFTTWQEAQAALHHYHETDLEALGYDLMIGVLASRKTIQGLPNRWPGRYPKVDNISHIWPNGREALKLVHYATDEPETLMGQLKSVEELAIALDGVQLNIAWPDPRDLVEIAAYTNVLQVGRGAMAACEFDPRRIADRLEGYVGCVRGVLFDTSGGRGELVDEALVVPILRECVGRGLPFSWGVAGGLSAATLHFVDPFFAIAPSLSIDAEGRLRIADGDRLNLDAVAEYLKGAEALVAVNRARAQGAA